MAMISLLENVCGCINSEETDVIMKCLSCEVEQLFRLCFISLQEELNV